MQLQVMREMGFEYDPTSAGSAVRFDPPNPRDPVSVDWTICSVFADVLLQSITFYKRKTCHFDRLFNNMLISRSSSSRSYPVPLQGEGVW